MYNGLTATPLFLYSAATCCSSRSYRYCLTLLFIVRCQWIRHPLLVEKKEARFVIADGEIFCAGNPVIRAKKAFHSQTKEVNKTKDVLLDELRILV